MKTEKIIYKSYNGEHNIAAWLICNEDKGMKGIVQIAHGMKEYFLRYNEFIEFLLDNGYAVCGNDHVGHGESLDGEAGFMGRGNVCEVMVNDMRALFKIVKGRFPKVPYYLFGHSMGAFAVRVYASKWAYELNGLILCGTGDQNFYQCNLYKGAALLCGMSIGVLGTNKKIKMIESIIFGSFMKHFEPIKTKADWQTSDETRARAFVEDTKSDFCFSLGGYKAIAEAIIKVSSPKWVETLPKTLPILIFSGSVDPVGNFGEGVNLLYERLGKAGLSDVSLKIYEGGRHEMLHEVCRKDVYADIVEWLEKKKKLT